MNTPDFFKIGPGPELDRLVAEDLGVVPCNEWTLWRRGNEDAPRLVPLACPHKEGACYPLLGEWEAENPGLSRHRYSTDIRLLPLPVVLMPEWSLGIADHWVVLRGENHETRIARSANEWENPEALVRALAVLDRKCIEPEWCLFDEHNRIDHRRLETYADWAARIPNPALKDCTPKQLAQIGALYVLYSQGLTEDGEIDHPLKFERISIAERLVPALGREWVAAFVARATADGLEARRGGYKIPGAEFWRLRDSFEGWGR